MDFRLSHNKRYTMCILRDFQYRGIPLFLHIVGQGTAMLAAGAGRVGCIFYIFHLSSISNVLSFVRRLT